MRGRLFHLHQDPESRLRGSLRRDGMIVTRLVMEATRQSRVARVRTDLKWALPRKPIGEEPAVVEPQSTGEPLACGGRQPVNPCNPLLSA